MKKIDTHLHMAYDGLEGKCRHMDVADGKSMRDYMKKHNVEHGVILSGGEFEGNIALNIDVCALAHKYPQTFSWLCNIDVNQTNKIEERLSHYKGLGAKGVGEFVPNHPIDDFRIETVFAACEKLEMPIMFHMSPKPEFNYGIVDYPGLPLLEKALQKFPKLILIGHSQPFWYEIGGEMPQDYEARNEYPLGKVKSGGRLPELFRTYPNLYGDLSANSAGNAVMRDPEFGCAFLEEFQDRLMFATDMVNTEMYFPLGDWLDDRYAKGALSEAAYKKICKENAIRIYRLEF